MSAANHQPWTGESAEPQNKTGEFDLPAPTAAPASALRSVFERFEYKYWLPRSVGDATVQFALPYLKPDVRSPADGPSQRSTSIYLDTPELDFYQAHVNSAPDRFKLRVRAYGAMDGDTAFFEIKRKVKSVIVKKRAGVPMALVGALLKGDYLGVPPLSGESERENLEAFLYYQMVHRAAPAIVVTCQRDAFAANHEDEDVRLTIDRDIAYQPARGTDFSSLDPRGWVGIDGASQHGESGARVLLELKFSGTAPLWMQEVVHRLGMWRSAYSKYVAAVAYERGDRYRADWNLVSAV